MQAEPGRSGSPGPSAYPRTVPPHPHKPYRNRPWGSRRARTVYLWYPEPPSPAKAAAGDSGQPWKYSAQRMAADGVTGAHGADAWAEPDFAIWDEAKGKKWEHWGVAYSRKTRVSWFPCIFGSPTFPSSGFWRSDRLLS